MLDAQKNRLIETVLLSTNNISFGWEIRKLFFFYVLAGILQAGASIYKEKKIGWILIINKEIKSLYK